MSEAWKEFFEMYGSSAADNLVFIALPLLWFGCIFISRLNCWQISKTILFITMYGHVFISLLGVLLKVNDSGAILGLWVLMVILGPFFPWLAAIILNIIELVYYCRKRIRSVKGTELKYDMVIRSTLQLLFLLAAAWGHFYTTVVHLAAGVSC